MQPPLHAGAGVAIYGSMEFIKLTVKDGETGVSGEAMVPAGSDLMMACEDASLPVAFGCGQGVCGSCRVKIVHGDAGEPLDDERNFLAELGAGLGERLACRVSLRGTLEVETLP